MAIVVVKNCQITICYEIAPQMTILHQLSMVNAIVNLYGLGKEIPAFIATESSDGAGYADSQVPSLLILNKYVKSV